MYKEVYETFTMVHGAGPVTEQEQIEKEYRYKIFHSTRAESPSIDDNNSRRGASGEIWLLINNEDQSNVTADQHDLAFGERLIKHDSCAFVNASGKIGFIAREAAHVWCGTVPLNTQ